jgi:putative ABC transport system permease protein
MRQNYLKIAFRGLWRKRTFSFINIMGLAVGIAACLVLFLLIRRELSFDTFHTKRDRVYRVISAWTGGPDGNAYDEGVPVPLADAVRNDFPQFSKVAAMYRVNDAQYTIPGNGTGDKKIRITDGIFYTEPSLFDILDFPWLAGNPATALTGPNTMAIEESVAKAWFGDWRSAMGKTVLMDNTTPFMVTGILKDHPDNTDVPIRIALSYASYPNRDEKDWYHVSNHQSCFVLLGEGRRIEAPAAMVPDFVLRHYLEEDKSVEKSSVQFQPLKGMHFDDRMGTYGGPGIGWKQLWALSLIGLFLLAVACINFINLSTAQSVNRAKEIGVRKVMGSSRGELVRQFLGETALITTIALFLACIIAELAIPWLQDILGKPIRMDVWQYPSILLFLVLTGVVVTFLSGFYPGLILSGFDPVTAIKSKIPAKMVGGLSLRRGLVVFQFAIAQMLIIGTLVVVKQMNFFNSQPLGFDKEAIALVDLPTDTLSQKKFAYLKQLILQERGVEAASLCSAAPSSGWVVDGPVRFDNRPNPETFTLSRLMADTDYYRTFHIRLLAGRLPYASDSSREYVLNEKAVHKLGFKNLSDVLGKAIHSTTRSWPIVGVIGDFNSTSLHDELRPLGISTRLNSYKKIAVRLNPSLMKTTLQGVQADWEKVFPAFLYHQVYFDEDLATYYEDEQQTAQLFKVFAGIALFISCLGLYGLVSFMAVQRIREMGIRKVLGASIGHIVYLFSREFTILVGVAFVLSAPLGYYFMQKWLNGFYYRVDIGWKIFVLSVTGSILLAWITVGYKALRAAMANPVNSLRTE